MDGATARSGGIGRRRGARNGNKSLLTSIIVAALSCTITCLLLLTYFILFGGGFPSFNSAGLSSSISSPNSLEGIKDTSIKKKGTSWMEQNKERFSNEIGKVSIRKTNNRKDTKAKKIKNTKTINTKHDKDDIFELIAKAELDLIAIDTSNIIVSTTTNPDGDVTTSKYEGVTATFCKLHWTKYKKDPPSLPMFRMLVEESDCDSSDNRYTMDLADIARKLDEHEAEYEEKYDVHVMPPAGFIFHESRVGSTLVSNSLTAMDPAAHRVYSESDPINQAFGACKSFTLCDMETNVDLLRDVVYLLGRTSVPTEKRMFFKVSSAFTTRIDVMQAAFEYVPWLFVFRNPVQTMMSHIDPTKLKTFRGASYPAVCLRSKHHPSEELQSLVLDKYDPDRRASELSDVEFCAAHLVRDREMTIGVYFFFVLPYSCLHFFHLGDSMRGCAI